MDNITELTIAMDNLSDKFTNITNNIEPSNEGKSFSSLVPATMFAAGVFGNSLALFVLCNSPKDQRRTVFYRLVAALAFTDLFGTTATSPVVLVVYNQGHWVGGQSVCDYFAFMLIFAGLATVFLIGAMAFDRFMALKNPYIYHAYIKYKQATYIIIALWLCAIAIALLPILGLGENVKQFPWTWCFFQIHGQAADEKAFAILYSILGISIILTIAVLNIILITTLCQMRKKAPHSANARNIIQCEVQMVIFLVGVTIVFSVCYGPLMFRVLLLQMGLLSKNIMYDLIVIRFASFNQILDPWVYLLFRRDLVRRLISIVQKQICPTTYREKNKALYNYVEATITTDKMVTLAHTSEITNSPTMSPRVRLTNPLSECCPLEE